MEAWIESVKKGDILVTYDNIVNFITTNNLVGANHHSETWDDFVKFLRTKGYDSWSSEKKRAASNTFHHFKWGYLLHSKEYYRKNTPLGSEY